MNKKRLGKSKNIYWAIITVLFSIAIILNVLAWMSRSFCDAYIENVFPVWGRIYGIFTNLTNRSVGEIMLYLAAVLILFVLIAIIWLFVIKVSGKGGRFASALKGYLRIILLIIAIEAVVMTLNCFILYHCSTFNQKYMPEIESDRKYTIQELAEVRDVVVNRANALAEHMQRDEEGNIIYDGDMAAAAIREMKKLGEKYPQLDGYYGHPKAFATSEFFSQQYMMGYYFPFSMEANYNDVMYIANIPATMCHELAHTKGFIYEDEANFIGFLACLHSEDEFVEYCGYLSVISYLSNDLYESLGKDKVAYSKYAKASDLVVHDRVFLTKSAWEQVEKKAVLDTETVKEASNKFIDTNLKVNGIDQGAAMYSEVVDYLIDYYMSGLDEYFCR